MRLWTNTLIGGMCWVQVIVHSTGGVWSQEHRVELVEPHDRMPTYELSNLEDARDRNGKRVFRFSFNRKNENENFAEVRIRLGNSSSLNQPFVSFNHKAGSGTVRFRPDEAMSREIDRHGIEVFLTMELLSSRRGTSGIDDTKTIFKISNSLTYGGARRAVSTRPANASEQRRVESWLEFKDRPATQPPESGMEMLTSTTQATPGLPIMHQDLQGDWHAGEIIDVDDNWIYFLSSDTRINDRLSATFSRNLAARSSDLKLAASDNSPYRASVMRPAGTSAYLPLDWSKVGNDKLVPGTPIKYVYGKTLYDAVIKDDQLLPPTKQALVWDKNAPMRRKILVRSTLKVREKTIETDGIYVSGQVLEALNADDASERFAPFATEQAVLDGRNLFSAGKQTKESSQSTEPASGTGADGVSGTMPSGEASGNAAVEERAADRKLKRYPITIPLPQGGMVVPPGAPLIKGMKLAACYSKKWYFVTVLETHDDGLVRCNWDDWPTYTYDMERRDLVVSAEALFQIELQLQRRSPTSRLWSDKTGQFRVQATYVESKEGYVQLKKEDGQLLSVEILRLSVIDRRLIRALASEKK